MFMYLHIHLNSLFLPFPPLCVVSKWIFFPLLSLPCCSVLGQVLCHGPVAEPLGDKLLEAEGSSYTVIAFEWAVGQLQAKVLGLPNPLHTAEM